MIPPNLNHVCEWFEKFDNFCVTNGVFSKHWLYVGGKLKIWQIIIF
jgi:hypothetical protein